jgi:hypothetical protein
VKFKENVLDVSLLHGMWTKAGLSDIVVVSFLGIFPNVAMAIFG